MSYSTGDPREPLPGDAHFETIEDAEIAALNQAYALINDNPIVAVWEDGGGEVVALVFSGVIYRQ